MNCNDHPKPQIDEPRFLEEKPEVVDIQDYFSQKYHIDKSKFQSNKGNAN